MPWPTNIDYQEAIQHPSLCFNEHDLKCGSVETDRLGLPRPFSGNFASVYKIKCGNSNYAVRCFLREFHDQKERYQEISRHLRTENLPNTAGFDFISNGIRVRGQWYPILKMEWIRGTLLHEHIRNCLGSPKCLADLARKWVMMCKAMTHAGIAHGDFQHGNILVTDGHIKLIDYDGMYVPALFGRGSHEIGHPNYQHPRRTSDHYNAYLDNFSAWVVYLSLVALSVDPNLWKTLAAGDECLLFKQEDFANPDSSRAFAVLENHNNSDLQSLALMLKSFIFLEPHLIPTLDGQTVQLPDECENKSSWISDYVNVRHNPPDIENEVSDIQTRVYDGTWVIDHILDEPSDTASLRFSMSFAKPRILIVISIGIGTALLTGCFYLQVVPLEVVLSCIPVLVLVNIAYCLLLYQSDPAFQERRHRRRSVENAKSQMRSEQETLLQLQKDKQKIRSKEVEESGLLTREGNEANCTFAKKVSAIRGQLNDALAKLMRERQRIEGEREGGLRPIRDSFNRTIQPLDQEISSIGSKEAQELSDTLTRLQTYHCEKYLKEKSIFATGIRGLPLSCLQSLKARGISTAYDIDQRIRCVPGIGAQRERHLMTWRDRMEIEARARMPKSLALDDERRIRSKYSDIKQRLVQERSGKQAALQSESDKIARQYDPRLAAIQLEQHKKGQEANRQLTQAKTELDAINAALSQKRTELRKKYSAERIERDKRIQQQLKDVCMAQWRLVKAERELLSCRGIRFGGFIRRALWF